MKSGVLLAIVVLWAQIGAGFSEDYYSEEGGKGFGKIAVFLRKIAVKIGVARKPARKLTEKLAKMDSLSEEDKENEKQISNRVFDESLAVV